MADGQDIQSPCPNCGGESFDRSGGYHLTPTFDAARQEPDLSSGLVYIVYWCTNCSLARFFISEPDDIR